MWALQKGGGGPPPSKKSKKVDCGGWNHPDSEKNTRKTVYGKIGWACKGNTWTKGTGFDDYGPNEYWDDIYTYHYADPYVCWNKHLYKAYVDPYR